MPSYDVPEPGSAERVGDLCRSEAHQQGALQAGGHPAGQPAGADLQRRGVGQRLQDVLDGPVEARVDAAGAARPR